MSTAYPQTDQRLVGAFQRCGDGPLLSASRRRGVGLSVSGPALVADDPRSGRGAGEYRLYFAHHRGHSIRLATARSVDGPWSIQSPALSLGDTHYTDHIASPAVVRDESTGLWRLYFHGGSGTSLDVQSESVAVSADRDGFRVLRRDIGHPYWSVFTLRGRWYALVMPGSLYESLSGLDDFVFRGSALEASARHSSAVVVDDLVVVFYSRIGDCPEHIRVRVLVPPHRAAAWLSLDLGPALFPEESYEGSDLPVRPSRPGGCQAPSRDLRDPGALVLGDRIYVAYAAGGERAIGLAMVPSDALLRVARQKLKEQYG